MGRAPRITITRNNKTAVRSLLDGIRNIIIVAAVGLLPSSGAIQVESQHPENQIRRDAGAISHDVAIRASLIKNLINGNSTLAFSTIGLLPDNGTIGVELQHPGTTRCPKRISVAGHNIATV